MFDYYTIEEISDKSDLNIDQVLRLGMSGTIIFSILEHKPKNFEEIDEYIDENGKKVRRTRRNETTVLAGSENKGLQIKYISTEDIINVIENTKSNKNTLIRELFETRDIDPKKGKWMINNPLSISQKDLIIKIDEWEFYEKNHKKTVSSKLPLKYPEKVTILWLLKNVSIKGWFAFAGLCLTIFFAGIYIAETPFFKNTFNKKAKSIERSYSDK